MTNLSKEGQPLTRREFLEAAAVTAGAALLAGCVPQAAPSGDRPTPAPRVPTGTMPDGAPTPTAVPVSPELPDSPLKGEIVGITDEAKTQTLLADFREETGIYEPPAFFEITIQGQDDSFNFAAFPTWIGKDGETLLDERLYLEVEGEWKTLEKKLSGTDDNLDIVWWLNTEVQSGDQKLILPEKVLEYPSTIQVSQAAGAELPVTLFLPNSLREDVEGYDSEKGVVIQPPKPTETSYNTVPLGMSKDAFEIFPENVRQEAQDVAYSRTFNRFVALKVNPEEELAELRETPIAEFNFNGNTSDSVGRLRFQEDQSYVWNPQVHDWELQVISAEHLLKEKMPEGVGEIFAVEDYKGSTYGLDPDNLARVVYDREKGEWVKYERPVRIAGHDVIKEMVMQSGLEELSPEQITRAKDKNGNNLKWGYLFEVDRLPTDEQTDELASGITETKEMRYLVSGYPLGVFRHDLDGEKGPESNDYFMAFMVPNQFENQILILQTSDQNVTGTLAFWFNKDNIDDTIRVTDNLEKKFVGYKEYALNTFNFDDKKPILFHELGKVLEKVTGYQLVISVDDIEAHHDQTIFFPTLNKNVRSIWDEDTMPQGLVDALKEGKVAFEGGTYLYWSAQETFIPEEFYPETQTLKDY